MPIKIHAIEVARDIPSIFLSSPRGVSILVIYALLLRAPYPIYHRTVDGGLFYDRDYLL